MFSNDPAKSEALAKAAQNLRLYKQHQLLPRINDSIIGDSDSPGELVSPHQNRAAVLICLFEGNAGEIRVLLTRRYSSMSSHSGEVALPGGRWEEGDTNDADTALREAQEEIGLNPSSVEVVTVLEPFCSKRNIIVYPVVGLLWHNNGFNPVPNATEVESIFDAPLEMFLKVKVLSRVRLCRGRIFSNQGRVKLEKYIGSPHGGENATACATSIDMALRMHDGATRLPKQLLSNNGQVSTRVPGFVRTKIMAI